MKLRVTMVCRSVLITWAPIQLITAHNNAALWESSVKYCIRKPSFKKIQIFLKYYIGIGAKTQGGFERNGRN
jgi:hypothetical protein